MNQVLSFLNLLDFEGKLSITNVAVIVVLIKLAISPSASITEAGLLLVTLANYAHKRSVNQSNQVSVEDPMKPQIDEMAKKIEDMTSTVSALSMQSGIKKMSL